MADWYLSPNASLGQDWINQDVKELKRKLITANHILHHHGVVDAYGHISVRHPQRPEIYIMCGYMAPALVSSPDDLIEYWVEGSEPVDPNANKGYSERFIHGEMFRMFPRVNCVVHSHAKAVLPYVVSGVPLMPVFHMAGFLGSNVPVFDISTIYLPGEQQDLLVRNSRFGAELARKFQKEGKQDGAASPVSPDHTVVLMRRHGYTTHGADIETAVYRAIYTEINASVQTSAIELRSAYEKQVQAPPGEKRVHFQFEPLSKDMCQGCGKMNEGTQDKPWRLWVEEVKNLGLYVNHG